MAGGLNEVDASVYAVVDNICAVDLVLGFQVGVESLLNVLHDWTPRVIIVDEVSEPGGINDGQAKAHAILFNVRAGGLNRYSLGDNVVTGCGRFLRRIERGVEQSVHESRLSQSGLTWD